MEVQLKSDIPVTTECIERATLHLTPGDSLKRLPRRSSVTGEYFIVQRGLTDVGVMLDGNVQNSVSIDFMWLGSASEDDEVRSLRLLEDVQAAIMQACELSESTTKIIRDCLGTRACNKWLSGRGT